MGGLCGNITLGWLGQDRRDLVNKVEVSKNFVFFCLETADQIRIPRPSLCSTTTYIKSCPRSGASWLWPNLGFGSARGGEGARQLGGETTGHLGQHWKGGDALKIRKYLVNNIAYVPIGVTRDPPPLHGKIHLKFPF